MITFNVRNIFQFQLMGQSFHYTEVRTQNSRCWEEELENGEEKYGLRPTKVQQQTNVQ